MATLLDRRLPRIDYRAPVWMTLPSSQQRVQAQALNLSEKGLFIGTNEHCNIGERLKVSLPVADGELDVEGRVTWSRSIARSGAPAGIGIEFTDLDHHSLEQVKAIVGSDREHAIRVRFSGLAAPIRARASVTGEVLSLHTELPFLRLGSVADFSLEGDAESHRGRIRRVTIEPGGTSDVPRLRIEVDVLGIGVETHDVRAKSDRVSKPLTAPPVEIQIPEAAPRWIEPSTELSTERIARRRNWKAALVTGTSALAGFAITYGLLGPKTPAASAMQPPIVIAASSLERATTSPAFEPPALAPALPEESPATATDASPLVVDSSGTSTTVTLHLASGNASNLRHYLLSAPAGIAVNLPSAQLEAKRKVHWIDRGSAKRVWVRSLDEGSQVRIFFPDSHAREYDVRSEGDRLIVTIVD